jgi:hypothetical protein
MAFWLKRPGQSADEAEPIGETDDYEYISGLNAGVDEWSLALPHQCDAWEIAFGSLEETLAEAREFRAGLDEAIRRLERAQVEDGNEPARYAAARASAARSLRAVEAEAAGLGIDLVAELARWQAKQFEGWSPFAAMADPAFRRPWSPPSIPSGCYEASFGWVHVQPACRCARGRRSHGGWHGVRGLRRGVPVESVGPLFVGLF